ncbi:MAG: membrane dipeptidase [Trueperaceae bacterium]
MLVVDGHLDLAMNALQLNRDLLTSAHTIRSNELGTPGVGRAQGSVALPDMRRGKVAVSFATVFARSSGQAVAHRDYASPTQAYAIAQAHLAYYRALESAGHVRILEDNASLTAHMRQWEEWDSGEIAGDGPPLGLVIAMEGADPLLTPESIEEWHSAGVRIASVSHDGVGRFAGGAGSAVGITPLGARLLPMMARLGVVLDLSHASDRTFDDALQLFPGPVLASHSNCRSLIPHPRLLTDRQLSAIVERNGVVGVSMTGWQLRPGRRVGRSDEPRASLADFIDHIDHICQLAGNALQVGIGSNLAAALAREDYPVDIDTISDLQAVSGALAARGYSDADVSAVMHGNWLRLLDDAWGR